MTAITNDGTRPVTLPADAWMRLRIAGDMLSAVALNASSLRHGLPLSPRAVQSLAECSVEWDAARDAVHQLLQARR